ncbi:DNA-binding protein [Flavobacterium soyangense]|uniref:DNA-binding protein n=1 Tax=Flavobacterium soyangense TaxID=2023265 RepID=A0A930XWW6_9FLAO|nr:DNA-binding protein [Flavobacterium soyangense]MBF2709831.1 DNA-binding protein [Flavobacterium soyangense]
MKDLTVSNIDRQNILNNYVVLTQLQDYIGLPGMYFNEHYYFTKQQIADFYQIDIVTIERYLESNEQELKHNGYNVIKGKLLKDFKEKFGPHLNISSKTPQLGLFNFRSLLNIGMLLVESEMAKALRSRMLDIVIDSLNQKTGGSTKYINQRDEDFLNAILKEPQYRKEFTNALNEFLDLGAFKYSYYTDKIYQAIFKEKSEEYKRILKLEAEDNVRDTMYAEVLKLIASFETGLAHEMKLLSEKKGRKISKLEMDNLLISFAIHPLFKPLVDDARTKMATRDYGFRRVLHDNLEQYIDTISKTDFERFLGEKSKTLEDRIDENIDVFKRLKDR